MLTVASGSTPVLTKSGLTCNASAQTLARVESQASKTDLPALSAKPTLSDVLDIVKRPAQVAPSGFDFHRETLKNTVQMVGAFNRRGNEKQAKAAYLLLKDLLKSQEVQEMLNEKDEQGFYALDYAFHAKSPLALQMLVKNGAKNLKSFHTSSFQDKFGRRILENAQQCNLGVLQDAYGQTVYMKLVKDKDVKGLAMLVDQLEGEGISLQDKQGNTAIHFVNNWQYNHTLGLINNPHAAEAKELTSILINGGIRADLRNEKKETLLDQLDFNLQRLLPYELSIKARQQIEVLNSISELLTTKAGVRRKMVAE